jgi:hypothetical protein
MNNEMGEELSFKFTSGNEDRRESVQLAEIRTEVAVYVKERGISVLG